MYSILIDCDLSICADSEEEAREKALTLERLIGNVAASLPDDVGLTTYDHIEVYDSDGNPASL